MKIAVIGSGIGGLATAVRLAVKGHEVVVFEKNERPGGKIAEIQQDGFRFDTGPSLLTLPELIKDVFDAAGEPLDLESHFLKLKESCRYFYPDSKELIAYCDRNKFIEECRKNFDEDPVVVATYLNKAASLYKLTADIFLFSSLHRIKSYLKWSVLRSFLKIPRLGFYKSMHKENQRAFHSPHLVQLFDRYATYNGSNPFRAPATLNVISHLEHNLGAFFPKKGMYAIVDLLYDLAVRKGVKFQFNTLVEEIILQNKRAVGIKYNGAVHAFDRVVCNADVKYAAKQMMSHPKVNRMKVLESSSSALIFYWGINKKFNRLGTHNIFFSNDYEREFAHIFEQKSLTDDPTVYVFVSSKVVPTDAPQNGENWFVMINAPADSGQNWEVDIEKARKNIKRKINKMLDIHIDDYILFEKSVSPISIEEATLSANGALYGTSSNSMFSAFLRHPNFVPRIKNLYFVGGSVHPGGGIPLCLAGARIVSEEFPYA